MGYEAGAASVRPPCDAKLSPKQKRQLVRIYLRTIVSVVLDKHSADFILVALIISHQCLEIELRRKYGCEEKAEGKQNKKYEKKTV